MAKRAKRKFKKSKGTDKDKKQDKAIARLRRELMPEMKNFYRSYAPSATSVTLQFLSLDSITNGIDAYSRVGNKVHVKHIQINIYVRNTHATDNYQYRCAIVRDDASTFTALNSYINPATPIGNWNTAGLVQGGKYAGPGSKSNAMHVVWDSGLVDIDPAGPGVGCYTTNSVKVFRVSIPLNYHTTFENATTQAPDKNALNFLSVASSANLNESFEAKLSFYDS